VTDIAIFREAYAPLVRLAAVVPSPDSRREQAHAAAQALEDWLRHHHETTAALILGPMVQCAAGMAMHDADYLRTTRALCDEYDVHLVADEIAVGFGRTGEMFAHQHADIRPDFICLPKGLTGGTLPLSAVLTTDIVYEAFYDDDVARGFLHSHSYTGNPLACRAALATLELFEQTDALARNRDLAAKLDDAFESLSRHPRLKHARHLGMIWAWDIEDAPANFAREYFGHAMDRGLLLRPIGNTLYAMPPYVLDDEAVDHLGRTALAAISAGLLHRGLHHRDEALPVRAAASRRVRQEGLPAADGDPPHGAPIRDAHRDRRGRNRACGRWPCALFAQWLSVG
jgi:adenosylmethionine-8-amino-7-oxononanoate aminotransferase